MSKRFWRTLGRSWTSTWPSVTTGALRRGCGPQPEALDAVPVQLFQPDAETMAVALRSWAGEWGHQWVVVDTHPGATPATSGALQVANVVAVPVPLGCTAPS